MMFPRWMTVALIGSWITVQAPAAGAGPSVAIVQSSSIGPFVQATAAIVEALRADPLQPEVHTFDLESDAASGMRVLAEVHRAGPQLLITVGSLATSLATKDPSPLPVVFSMVLYPRQSGFLDGNHHAVTGASLDVPPDLEFRYLRRLVPSARRVGVLYHPEETGSVIAEAGRAAASHGFELIAEPVSKPSLAVTTLGKLMEEVDVVWSVADSHVFNPQNTLPLILAALRRRMPLFGLSGAHARAGAVAALSCDYADVGTQTAEIALRALRGQDLRGIPVSAPRKLALALNLRTAQYVGLDVSPDLESEAREVVR